MRRAWVIGVLLVVCQLAAASQVISWGTRRTFDASGPIVWWKFNHPIQTGLDSSGHTNHMRQTATDPATIKSLRFWDAQHHPYDNASSGCLSNKLGIGLYTPQLTGPIGGTNASTIMCWLKPQATMATAYAEPIYLGNINAGGGKVGYGVEIALGNWGLLDPYAVRTTGTIPVSLGWTHVAIATSDGGTSYVLYVNGTQSVSQAVAGSSAVRVLKIGDPFSLVPAYTGCVDDVRVYGGYRASSQELWDVAHGTNLPGRTPDVLISFDSWVTNGIADAGPEYQLKGSASWPPWTNNAYYFGQNDHFVFTNQTITNMTTNFTMSLWAYATSLDTDYAAAFSLETSPGYEGVAIGLGGTHPEIAGRIMMIGDYEAPWSIRGFTTTATGTWVHADLSNWQHIAIVHVAPSNNWIYKNGVSLPLATNGFPDWKTNTSAIYVGGDSAGVHPYKGFVDDARVYGRALSSNEIYQMHQGGRQ